MELIYEQRNDENIVDMIFNIFGLLVVTILNF